MCVCVALMRVVLIPHRVIPIVRGECISIIYVRERIKRGEQDIYLLNKNVKSVR